MIPGVVTSNPFEGKKVLSLDVFDTALFRPLVRWEDVNLVLDAWGEERIEKWLCMGNRLIKPWYHAARRAGLRVVFVSDTDHPASLIRRMLSDAGYEGRVYASSEHAKTKTSGLFEEMLKAEGVQPSEVIHVGDNQKADYEYPKSIGIDVRLIDRLQEGLREPYRTEKIDNHSLFALSHFNALSQVGVDYWYDVGHNHFGPALVAFAWWLDHHAKQDGRDRLYFMSSEGITLRQVYNIVAHDPLPNHYLHGSRRAWAVPAISLDREDPVDDVLMDRISFQWKDGRNRPEKPMHEIITRERPEVERYLDEQKVFDGRPGFVDIGYAGTMQLALKKYGSYAPWYYLATEKKARALDDAELDYKSYLCHKANPASAWLTLAIGIPVLESILPQDTGTTLGYKDGQPVLHYYKTSEEHQEAIKAAAAGIEDFAVACAGAPSTPVLPPEHAAAKLYELLAGENELDRLMLPRLVYYAVMGDGDKKFEYTPLNPIRRLKWLLSIKLKG